jgi:hypothetical protein
MAADEVSERVILQLRAVLRSRCNPIWNTLNVKMTFTRDIHIGSGEHIDVSIFTREKQLWDPESHLGHHRLIIGHDLVTCTRNR